MSAHTETDAGSMQAAVKSLQFDAKEEAAVVLGTQG